MNSVILSTKNTTGKYKIQSMTCNIIIAVLGILVMSFYVVLRSHYSGLIVISGGAALLFESIISGFSTLELSASYIEIYDDCVRGKAVYDSCLLDFKLNFSQITNVTTEGIFIRIHTNSGTYKIASDKETSKKVFEFFNS